MLATLLAKDQRSTYFPSLSGCRRRKAQTCLPPHGVVIGAPLELATEKTRYAARQRGAAWSVNRPGRR